MAEMFQVAFDQAMIGMALVAPDGRWLRANRALCTLLGYNQEELLSVGFRPLIERNLQVQGGDALARLLAGEGVAYETEQRFTNGRGEKLWLHLHVSLVRDGENAPTFLIVQARDVTAHRHAEEVRSIALTQLTRSNQELERFASIASHDLQEPLRKIRAFGDRLQATEGERISERGRDYLARMQQAATRMQELTNGLLSFSRVTNRPLEPVPTDLGQIVRDVLRDLEGQVTRTGGRVEIGPLPTISGDMLRLRQLFQNLVSNALKFHRPGVPPMILIRSEPFIAAAGAERDVDSPSSWRIIIEDNGIGFDEQYSDRIFGMFQRLHGRTEFEGSGIGLALCRQIVERHGGQITAKGRTGVGATFEVILPTELQRGEGHVGYTAADHHPAGG